MTNNIGSRITKARKDKGLNMQQLADLCGMNISTIYRIEEGQTKNVKLNTVAKIAEALHVDPIYLMMGYTDMIVYDTKSEIQFIVETIDESDRSRLLEMAKLMFGDKYGWKKD